MITKHFFKTLILFALMIGLGLVLIFVVSNQDKENSSKVLNTTEVAK